MPKKTKWIRGSIKKPGALKKTLGVKKGEKIPTTELKKAASGEGVSKKTEKRAELALTLRKINKKK